MTKITYFVLINGLGGNLELTISASDEDDIGLLRGRSDTPTQGTAKAQTPPTPWTIEETYIGTNDDDIRAEAEAAIREMGEIVDLEIH